jgi:hypothetical protein
LGADETGGSFAAPRRTFSLHSEIRFRFALACAAKTVATGVHTLAAVRWTSATTHDPPIPMVSSDDECEGPLRRGTWQFIATLSDGSQHEVWIKLR